MSASTLPTRHTLSGYLVLVIAGACIWSGYSSQACARVFSFTADFLNGGQLDTQSFRMWLPDDEQGPIGATRPVRGLVFVLPGSAEDYRGKVGIPNLQKAASALGFGLIGANSMIWGESSGETNAVVQSVLDAAASVSSRPELANAPYAAVGISQGGYNSTRITLANPDRAIGFANIRGSYFYDESTPFEETLRVPGLNIVASQDNIVLPPWTYEGWSSWRSQGAPHALAVDWDTTHYDTREGQSWELAWLWLGEMTRLRYPQTDPLSDQPGQFPELSEIDLNSGWLGHAPNIPSSGEFEYLIPEGPAEIGPIGTSFAELPSWLPSEGAARAFQAFTSHDQKSRPFIPRQGPLHFLLPPVIDQTNIDTPLFTAGETVEIAAEVHPYDEFINGYLLTEVDFFLDDTFLGTVLGENNWSIDVTLETGGIHVLSAIGRDSVGAQYPAFTTVLVEGRIPEPTTLLLCLAAIVFFTGSGRAR